MTRRMILDASATLAWLYDEDGGRARLDPVLRTATLTAPTLWLPEVTNSVLVLERRRKVTAAKAVVLLGTIDALPVELVAEPIGRTATELAGIARPHQLTTYDALYLDLAVRLRLPLLTRDGNLRAAAGRVGVPLVSEATP